jgi:hypothetical protein
VLYQDQGVRTALSSGFHQLVLELQDLSVVAEAEVQNLKVSYRF